MAQYSDEIAGLAAAYSIAMVSPESSALSKARAVVDGRDLFIIGSGGTLAAAELAADVHHELTGRLASAVSPLRFVEISGRSRDVAVVIFSARAKHPDTAFAASSAIAHGLPVVLFTQRDQRDLEGALSHPSVTVVTVPTVSSEGFLATQSVLIMAVAFVRMYAGYHLPQELSVPLSSSSVGLRERLLVLHGVVGRAAAKDIETRMHELGVVDVQLADWRNFAHGRHVGLARRAESSTVIALISPSIAQLAARTLSVLPTEIDVRVLESSEDGAAGALQLLASVMFLPTLASSLIRSDPSKPKVSSWGRDLYHLPFKRAFPIKNDSPPVRKARAAGFSSHNSSAIDLYSAAQTAWLARAKAEKIRALVLDYDGTCVATADRWSLPLPSVQAALGRLLATGIPIAFASGRGDSLYSDLRSWVPRDYWRLVRLGLHNGAWIQNLDAPLQEDNSSAPEWSELLWRRLQPFVDKDLIAIRSSTTQMAIASVDNALSVDSIRDLVYSESADLGARVKIGSSAHSVDIVDARFGKDTFLAEVADAFGTPLAIGDKGGPGGNDHAFLASTNLSITVDECSADPEKCWPMTGGNVRGPQALIEILDNLVARDGYLLFSAKNKKY